MIRPSEPNTDQENPEQWAAIAEWERDRADRLSDALDTLVNVMDDIEGIARDSQRSARKA